MMTMQITQRDLENLSAYLDEQLSPGRRARLEARLEYEPGLRVALHELQHTRGLLKVAPRLRAPHNFTLTPEMVGQSRQVGRLYPSFRLVSAIASLLFVLVIAGDFLGLQNVRLKSGADLAAPMAAAVQEEESAPQMKMMEVPEGEPVEKTGEELAAAEVFALDEEVAGTPEMESPEVASLPVSEGAPREPVAEAAEAEKAIVEEDTAVEEELPVLMGAAPQEAITLTLEIPPAEGELVEATRGVGVSDRMPEDALTNAAGERPPETPAPKMDAREVRTSASWGWTWIRSLEAALGLVALAAGIGAIYLRRRG